MRKYFCCTSRQTLDEAERTTISLHRPILPTNPSTSPSGAELLPSVNNQTHKQTSMLRLGKSLIESSKSTSFSQLAFINIQNMLLTFCVKLLQKDSIEFLCFLHLSNISSC
jgi:hypothetical protein